MRISINVADVRDIILRSLPKGGTIKSDELWKDATCVVLCIRRPGCVACRKMAQDLWARKPDLDAAGVRLAAVVHQSLPLEIEDFQDKVWPGPVYQDEQKSFYRALGEGEVRVGNLLPILNPFSRAWRNLWGSLKEVKHHNVRGDGTVFGGVMVVARGGSTVKYAFQETTYGDAAPLDELVKAAVEGEGRSG